MPGGAAAAAVDAASLPDVKGSVAGNDTVLVVCGTEEGADELVNLVNKLRNAKK